jgi:hypothetical protein
VAFQFSKATGVIKIHKRLDFSSQRGRGMRRGFFFATVFEFIFAVAAAWALTCRLHVNYSVLITNRYFGSIERCIRCFNGDLNKTWRRIFWWSLFLKFQSTSKLPFLVNCSKDLLKRATMFSGLAAN